MADRITAGTITNVEVDRIVVPAISARGGLVCPEVACDISSSVAQYNNSTGFFDKSVRPVRTAKSRLTPHCIRTDFTLALIDVSRDVTPIKSWIFDYNRWQAAASMDALNLNTPPRKLLAGQFPAPADEYICDRCGQDITKYLYHGQAHVRRPLGPIRYTCQCGQSYLSGRTEWDYLSNWAKRQWLMDIVLALVLLSGLAGFGILAYFAVTHRSAVLLTIASMLLALSIPLVPLYLAILAIPASIAASLWRTRIRGSHAE